MTVDTTVDVAVVGAGLAGLVCAQRLKQSGYQVVVIEKSRGVGGRLATRRLQNTCADHGVRYLAIEGDLSACLLQALLQKEKIQPWTAAIYTWQSGKLEPAIETSCYTAISGLTTAAKFLATELDLKLNQRVEALTTTPDRLWQLRLSCDPDSAPLLLARAVVLAIPAPQALLLLEPLLQQGLDAELVDAVRSVEFDPCFSVIATYAAEQQAELDALPWQAIVHLTPDLDWLSLETTKRPGPQPVVVAQSTGSFARTYLEAPDLQPIGQLLLEQADGLIPWLSGPTELQVHRWRYAFVHRPLAQLCLSANLPLPIVCSGDWCSGSSIENALESGLAAACQTSQLLDDRSSADRQNTQDCETQFLELMQQLTQSTR